MKFAALDQAYLLSCFAFWLHQLEDKVSPFVADYRPEVIEEHVASQRFIEVTLGKNVLLEKTLGVTKVCLIVSTFSHDVL